MTSTRVDLRAVKQPNVTEVYNLAEAARIMREALKDKSYRALPVGGEAGEYLRWKRGVLTPDSYRSYESCLDKLAWAFPDLEIGDFEPPVGVERIEEFMDGRWGDSAPQTYNKNLAILKGFFEWAVLKGKLHGDPTLPIKPHKKRDVHRETFSDGARTRILANGPHEDHLLRDRIALRLLLKYGLRKGALQKIQFKHFDFSRKRLTVFTKGATVRELPIVDAALWDDLAVYMRENDQEPQHYLMCRARQVWRGYTDDGGSRFERIEFRDIPLGGHALHNWWYGCLQRAGVVPQGVTSGEKMHKARHTAGQRVLDATGNLKAAQRLLGHKDISTTGNVYTDWDSEQLAETLRGID